MKWMGVALLALSALGLGALAISQFHGGEAREDASRPAVSVGAGVLGVEQFMEGVERYGGPVRVEGVVNTASAADHMLTLIDRREFDECGVTTCAALYLPVRWPGDMPGGGDTVRIEGEARDEGGKLVFVARKLDYIQEP